MVNFYCEDADVLSDVHVLKHILIQLPALRSLISLLVRSFVNCIVFYNVVCSERSSG